MFRAYGSVMEGIPSVLIIRFQAVSNQRSTEGTKVSPERCKPPVNGDRKVLLSGFPSLSRLVSVFGRRRRRCRVVPLAVHACRRVPCRRRRLSSRQKISTNERISRRAHCVAKQPLGRPSKRRWSFHVLRLMLENTTML